MKLFTLAWIIFGLTLASACSPEAEENDRRDSMREAALGQKNADVVSEEGSNVEEVDAVIDDQPLEAVILDVQPPAAVPFGNELNLAGLPEDFLAGLRGVAKIAAGKILLYGNDNVSWLLSEGGSLLEVLTSEIIPPAGSRQYVMEDGNFWLMGESTLAFPSPPANGQEQQGQISIVNITPELMQNPEQEFRTLHVSPSTVMLSRGLRLNIVIRREGRARFIYLDYPSRVSESNPVRLAGEGVQDNEFWFLTDDSLLILRRGSDERWRWLISDFQLDATGGVAHGSLNGAALMVDASDENDIKFVGNKLYWSAERLYAPSELNLSIISSALVATFNSDVQPLLQGNCVGCHGNYDQIGIVRANAANFKAMIENDVMPPDAPLVGAARTTIINWLDGVLAN